MKHYKLEPTYKKSLVELYTFKRPLSDLVEGHENRNAILVKEIGWRWGDFTIDVPETEAEVKEWLEYQHDGTYETFDELVEDYGLETENKSIQEVMEEVLLPDLDDDYIMISEDYPDAQMNSTWDGCWEDWDIRVFGEEVEIPDVEDLIETIDDAYNEEYEEGVEALGWEFMNCEYEMHCKPMLTPIDENGNDIGEPMQSESDE